MSIFVSFCAALAAALVVITIVQTWAAYPQLPDRVALQFELNGAPRSYGPRWTIWVPVLIQVLIGIGMAFTGYAIATHAPGVHGTLTGFSIFTVLFNALIWRVQTLLLSAAKSAEYRLPMKRFWPFVAVWIALILVDAIVIG